MTGPRECDLTVARKDLYHERRVGAPARTGAVYWPILTDDEAAEEWERLRIWVELLRVRFPHSLRLPDCWWQHNDLVEALSALRDHERASYAPDAPGTGPVEWHRALRELETRIENWIKRFSCTLPGRGHRPLEPDLTPPAHWHEHLTTDSASRPPVGDNTTADGAYNRTQHKAASTDNGATPDAPESPTYTP